MKFELTEEQIDTVITALHMQQTGVASNITQELTRQRQDQPTEDTSLTFEVLDVEGDYRRFQGKGILVEEQALFIRSGRDIVATYGPGQWRRASVLEALGKAATGGEGDDAAGGTSDGGGA